MKSSLSVLSILALGVLDSGHALAAGIKFNFLVNSSGTQLYPCDAGLYDPKSDGYESYLKADKKTYGDYFGGLGSWSTHYVPANLPGTTDFKTVVTHPTGISGSTSVSSKFNNVIYNSYNLTPPAVGELTFNLASQQYGATYYVDFCFRDSEIGWYPDTDNGSVKYEYLVKDEVTPANLSGGAYLANSLVKVRGLIICDETSITESYTLGDSTPLFSGGATSGFLPATAVPMNTGAQKVLSNPSPLTIGSTSKPTQCIIRYRFEETSTNFRLNTLNSAQFTIDLSVSRKPKK